MLINFYRFPLNIEHQLCVCVPVCLCICNCVLILLLCSVVEFSMFVFKTEPHWALCYTLQHTI